MPLRPRRAWLDLLLLSALCGLMYFTAPTSHGLTNWQEAMRALVAREMHSRLESGQRWAWLVPTVWDQPYLAKPPLIYWCQLLLARITGGPPGELHLRLTVAIAGWLGVILTYLAARSMLRPASDDSTADRPWPDHVAWWSSLFLATGILHVRSSRIGELDILLVPTSIGAVWAIHRAWRTSRERARVDWPALGLATLFAALATLTKGPPALLAIGLAGYGGILLWAALDAEARAGPRLSDPSGPSRSLLPSWTLRAGGAITGIAIIWAGAGRRWNFEETLGIFCLAVMGLGLLWLLTRLADRARLFALWTALKHTHPIGVLGLAALGFWGWGRLVASLVGSGTVRAAAAEEAADNLRLLVAESPVNNLEAASYGVGLGSFAAIIAVIWLLKDRPALRPGWYTILAWCGLGLIAFSTLGKGVPRYLTPLWPGIAMLGGLWMASAIRDFSRGRILARATLISALTLGLAQGWWYAAGRELAYADRSPRAFIASLLPALDQNGREPIATFEFSTPALDFYARREIESFHDVTPRRNLRMVGPRTIADLRRDLQASGGSCILLVRTSQPGGMDPKPAVECLSDAGLMWEPIEMPAFTIDNGRTPVMALRIRAGAGPASD
ncbi:MAG: glycosyltransferase family 39 protein [Phycisphaerales bacterium]|nr:glycosyltransferase family 39 protein [Phycisphaerales bacterium]